MGAAHELAVDVGAVRAAEVAHHDRTTRYFEFGVTARNIWMIQHDLAGHRLTADCQAMIERQAIGHGGDRPIRSHDSRPRGGACAGCGPFALGLLIASDHGLLPHAPMGRPS